VLFCGREPDDAVGEMPVAFVVRSNGSDISEEEIKKYIAAQVTWTSTHPDAD
jgi:4-coumarate--CoA ligase